MLQGMLNDGLTVIIPSDLMPWNNLQEVDLTESYIVWTAASQPITTRASYLLARSDSFFRRLEVHIQTTNWWSKLLLNTSVLTPFSSKLNLIVSYELFIRSCLKKPPKELKIWFISSHGQTGSWTESAGDNQNRFESLKFRKLTYVF